MDKRSALAPLAQIRIDLERYSVELQSLNHQVSALPTDHDLEYYFVPHQYMKYFADLHRPVKSFKNLKLVNYDQPAIALSFFFKHKYKIERNVNPVQATTYIKEHRDYLYNLSFLQQLSSTQKEELKRTDELLRVLRQHPGNYQFCFSNYLHYYRYWYCTFRFFDDEEKMKTSTLNEHLLKFTKGSQDSSPQERLNIIFVDSDYITRPVPYDNKLIDRELETFPERFSHGTTTLFFRELII